MAHDRTAAAQAAAMIAPRLPDKPRVGIMAGTGLGQVVAGLTASTAIPYGDIPHFPESTVMSHAGQLVTGMVADRPIVAMQGRFHLYEGYTPAAVTFPVRVMQALGVRHLIVTNAAGGLNPAYQPGDVMLLADHINLTGDNPLIGPNDDTWGERFPDMSAAYPEDLRTLALATGEHPGLSIQTGIYAGLKGPSLETPAEIRYLRTIGADAVGFSTVQETIAAVHAGMQVLGMSIVTNVHTPNSPVPATVAEIIDVAEKTAPAVSAWIARIVAGLPLSE